MPSSPTEESGRDQELIQAIRTALRSEHPLDLLTAVSGLLTATDPRGRDPFSDDQPTVTLEDLVDSFVGVDYAETTAALMVIRAMVPDELLAARIGKVLSGRRQPMPRWLQDLESPRISRVVAMRHVLGDGDDYFLEARLPSGETLTGLVYVDHNMGTVVKDAFIIPDSFEAIERTFHEKVSDPDTTFTDSDPADMRATVADAIAHGVMVYPPLETDTWPICRPLVEWLLRSLPEGGSAPEHIEWSEEDVAALRDDFLASTYSRGMDTSDESDLLENLIWFGSGWAGSDPLRWSPVNVEILLVDWMPRKISGAPSYLAKAPDVLRAFIRYAHHRRGIRGALTEETLAAVDRWEPEFQRLIRSSRPQGPEALLSQMLDEPAYDDDAQLADIILNSLERAVGGRMVLMNLDDEPLPDEPFEWAGLPDDIHARVAEVLERCDRCAEELLDVQHRTAFRRFLSRAAVGDPTIFRRKGSADRAAAAVCWTVAKANETVGYASSPLESQQLLGWFGVKGSVSQRAEVFLRAVGVDPYHQYGQMDLGAVDLLVRRRRAQIIEVRDIYLESED